MPARIRVLTVIYLLILAGIIAIADYKSTSYLLNFVGNIPFGDKIGHFILFGFCAFLVNLSLGGRNFGIGNFRLIVAIIITLEEITQIFVRGRTFSSIDLLCGYAGILIFGEVARMICRKYPPSSQPLNEKFGERSG
jgi:hypothetical protein